ncbi:MAG: dTMP kinase [Roseburia sp.]|nr:dTMP kinase [Anaeroplasma bactoclasticum]MCM1196434.1 dTMP kinase [Roseburia sp.]MCM1557585.1 dTMP kinase [Anaeroplasma bactoclasticum]
MKGLFITFEGGECSGKTTIIQAVCKTLEEKGISYISTREPGGIDIAEQIRSIILDVNNTAMTEETEALLYAASRMQHLKERVLPAIKRGDIVICDRFLDSSIAYQGYARKLGIDAILKVNHFALKHLPDLTLFIDVKPEVALKRLSNRNKSDRLDLEKLEFHQNVYKGYEKVCQMYPDRIKRIDGNRPLDDIVEECISTILQFIGRCLM